MKSYENCKVNEWNFIDVPETVWPWDIVVRPRAAWELGTDNAVPAKVGLPVPETLNSGDGARIAQSEASSVG